MKQARKFRQQTRSKQGGQAAVFLLLGMGFFLLGGIGLAVDMANLWMHREAAQNAADAACTAAAADLISDANGANNAGGFSPGNKVVCSSAGSGPSGPAPCQYAAFNGYAASGLSSSPSTEVIIDNENSITAPVQSCSSNTPPAICSNANAVVNNSPFVGVTVTDRTQSFFLGLLSGKKTMDINASATCGAVLANSPIPVQVLSPNVNNALDVSGTLSVIGGPQRSVQVNSTNNGAINGGTINLQLGGPQSGGSDLGVSGGNGATVKGGNVIAPAIAVSDPFAQLQAPAQPTALGTVANNGQPIPQGQNGCPDPAGCYEYTPGYYPNGICVGKNGVCAPYHQVGTAIFDPGIYYVVGGFFMHRLSCVWPSTALGDGSGGTMFYFADNNSFATSVRGGNGCPSAAFNLTSGSGSLQYGVGCTASSSIPGNLKQAGSITGASVLVAPCQLPTQTALCTPNCGINYGDPLGTNDPLGEQRGILFFQNRGTAVHANANWNGTSGQFLLAGNIYIHQCVTSGTDTGVNCSASTAYNDSMSFSTGCNAGTNHILFGQLVVDQLSLDCVTADLNPGAVYYVLKADLLQ